jgi:hypothetical protein
LTFARKKKTDLLAIYVCDIATVSIFHSSYWIDFCLIRLSLCELDKLGWSFHYWYSTSPTNEVLVIILSWI